MEKVSSHKIVLNRRMASHQAIYAVVSTYWEVSSRNRVCKQKMCCALWWTDILFSQRVIKFILGENGWIMALCAVYAERHCMEPMLDAKKCLGCHCMPVHFPTVQAVNGRHWVGIGTERKRFLACGCGRGRMGTGADPFWMIDHSKNRPAEW